MADLRFADPPRLGPLLARGVLHGAGRRDDGAPLPASAAVLDGHRTDVARLAAYARLCGFALRDRLPATWLHVLTFPLQVALMTEREFPYGVAGLVHHSNEMTVHRPALVTDALALVVRAGNVRAHRKGVLFDMLGEVRAGGELAWSGRSTYLAPGATAPGSPTPLPPDAPLDATRSPSRGSDNEQVERLASEVPIGEAPEALDVRISQRWRLPADLGRRYAAVSGDVNPIHLSPVTARLFGYKRPLVHGMWTHARALAALDARLPETYTIGVRFTRPLLLPTTAGFGVAEQRDGPAFVVSTKDSKPALVGEVRSA